MRSILSKSILALIAIMCILFTCCDLFQQPAVPQTPPPPATTPAQSQTEKPPQPDDDVEAAGLFPVTVTDGLGRQVTIKSLPRRIVSLAPSNTEILFALGLDDRIIGVTDYCNYPEAAKLKPHVAGYTTPDLEKLVSLSPDLIVAESVHEKTVMPALEGRGFTVILLQSHSLQEILDNISMIGRATGKIKNADKLITEMRTRIDAIAEKTKTLPQNERLRVLYVVWNDPVWTMGRNTYIDDMISKAGGRNIFAADFEKSRVVSPEAIVARNPQVIIVSGMGTSGDTIAKNLRQQLWIQTADAVKQGNVFVISNPDIIERPGPRIVLGLEEVSRILQKVKSHAKY